ncbi:polysaccharide biosynthesis/export family protein [Pokkaliibacter sp. CJK22405]|uniref:polysaccharide biosynthesis/export family protein n=1 Tax=Pokkaliibacter sp. CJK22405 TaxID=3384615 RepID=UPI003984C258
MISFNAIGRRALTALICLLPLAGCGVQDKARMPVSTTVGDITPVLSESLPVESLLRPEDQLEVIYHLSNQTTGSYHIEAGDQLELSFLTAPELSGSRLVLPDGTIPLTYVGSLLVAGLTVEKAREAVNLAYGRVLNNPQVTLSISRSQTSLDSLRESLTNPNTGLSHQVTIASDGFASFPLIGSLPTQGLSLSQLQQTLNQRYAENQPQVSVDVLLQASAAKQVYLLGEVQQPGAYPVTHPISILEALSMARGTNIGASLDSVVLMRRQGNQVQARVYDVEDALDGKAMAMLYLQPDDLIYVPKSHLTKAGELARQMADVILFQGVNFGLSYRVDNKNTVN